MDTTRDPYPRQSTEFKGERFKRDAWAVTCLLLVVSALAAVAIHTTLSGELAVGVVGSLAVVAGWGLWRLGINHLDIITRDEIAAALEPGEQ